VNPLNYTSLEASQRLVEAGIVLETDCYWHCAHGFKELKQGTAGKSVVGHNYPAPSMAEVWRELPEMIGEMGSKHYLTVQRLGGFTEAGYELAHHDGVKKSFENTNPTDALTDLLIWVTEQRREKG
jgi:hypothetical protein